MKWVAISGSWRTVNEQVEQDVRQAVRDILQREGFGIVSGGALGVDWIATDEALMYDKSGERIRIILPTTLPIYANHFRKRAREGVITMGWAELLIGQMEELVRRNPATVEEMDFTICDEKSYHARNTRVIEVADELAAFHVNGSAGVQDAIDKAFAAGMPVHLSTYNISAVA